MCLRIHTHLSCLGLVRYIYPNSSAAWQQCSARVVQMIQLGRERSRVARVWAEAV